MSNFRTATRITHTDSSYLHTHWRDMVEYSPDVRSELWRCPTFHTSKSNIDIAKLPSALFNRFVNALDYAA
jgi:hypothetical protein